MLYKLNSIFIIKLFLSLAKLRCIAEINRIWLVLYANSATTRMAYSLLLARVSLLLTCFFIPLSTTLTDIFFLLTAIFGLLSAILCKQLAELWRLPVVKILLLATVVVLIGLSYSWAPWGEALKYSKKYLWLLLTPFLFALGNNTELRVYALKSFLVAIGITLIFSFINYFDPIHFYFVKGSDSIFKDHIIQSFLMSMSALICLLQLNSKGAGRILFFAVFLLSAINILFLSEGRIGYILLPVVIIYSWIVNYGWRKVFIPLLMIVILFSTALRFSSHMQERLLITEKNVATYNFLSKKDSQTSLGIRRIMWDIGIKLISERPFFGYGTGSIRSVLRKIPDSWIIENNWIRSKATFESSYLNIACQFGLIGLVLFIVAAYMLWQQTATISDRYWRNLLRGIMIAMMVGCFFNPWLESTTEKHFFAVMLFLCFPGIRVTINTSKLNTKTQQNCH